MEPHLAAERIITLTSQSLGFIAQTKFSEICKRIYKEIQKQNKKERVKQ